MRTLLSCELSGDVSICGPFFFFFFFLLACLLVIEVGDVRGYPFPVSGKLAQIFQEGKNLSDSPRSSAFSGLARLLRLAADR